MKRVRLLTQAIVRELLTYNPRTGLLTWEWRKRKWFKRDRDWRMWNTRYAGKPAFTALTGDDRYRHGAILGRDGYLAHRVIFLWMTGSWPRPEVDHDNRIGTDNRWRNLKEATDAMNARNRFMPRNNSSGRSGVNMHKGTGKYQARIGVDGKRRLLGYFDTFAEASLARKNAERKYGYSKGHGRARFDPPRRDVPGAFDREGGRM